MVMLPLCLQSPSWQTLELDKSAENNNPHKTKDHSMWPLNLARFAKKIYFREMAVLNSLKIDPKKTNPPKNADQTQKRPKHLFILCLGIDGAIFGVLAQIFKYSGTR